MRLILNRSQKSSMMGGKVVFSLSARAELTPDEQAALEKYKFNREVLYSKENVRPGPAQTDRPWAALARDLSAAALNLTITVDSLVRGKTVECKSITEMLDVEETIRNSCEMLKELLLAASSFEGETVYNY